MPVYKIKASRIQSFPGNATTYIGEDNSLFYDHDTGILRLSDGVTPGGRAIIANGNVIASNGGGGGLAAVTIQDDGEVEGDVTTLNFTGADVVVANGVATIPLGGTATPVDGNLSAEDLFNLITNRHNNTWVGNTIITASQTSPASGEVVNFAITIDGNANQHVINWGDGTTITTSSLTPTHSYTNAAASPFTVSITSRNTNGTGFGSFASQTRANYITLFAAVPTVSFQMFNVLTGGTALAGTNKWVIEGDTLYVDNNTTNTSGADVTYSVNWGDGNSDTISSDTEDGGVSGDRLAHIYGTSGSSGNGEHTVTLTLLTHSSVNPALLPIVSSQTIKVYDREIGNPQGLGGRTIAFAGSTGNSPYLVANFTDQTGGTSGLSAGSSVLRTTATSGTINSTEIVNFAWDANSGVVSAYLNSQVEGSRTLTTGSDVGTYGGLVISSESDYNLLGVGGEPVAFAQSIYYPGRYRGFKTRLGINAANVGLGTNQMWISHSTTGNTSSVSFVKDDLTSAPTVNGGVISEQTRGTYRYISGVPYYNSGSPEIRLSGIAIQNLTGQTYTNATDIVSVEPDVNQESTVGSIFATQNFTYTQINNTGNSMLVGGIPTANVGRTNSYAINNLDIPLAPGVRSIQTLKYRAKNVNGTTNYRSLPTAIAVHSAPQSGISEVAIQVSAGLGNGVFTDNAVRTFALSASDQLTPPIPSGTNLYVANVYTETEAALVDGTQEATILWGAIRHVTTNFSQNRLPIGPDRSGDTGTQYFTFVFRRQVVSNFSITIAAPTGVNSVWIAAPGTAIDQASSINGWLDCAAQYGGSGVPGADAGNGGNGSNGCAASGSDRILSGTALSGSFQMTLGTESLSNATNNICLVRIALDAGQTVTGLSIS